MKTLKILFMLIITLFAVRAMANDVQVTNVSYDNTVDANGNTTITFDLSWKNSWRTSTTQPYNYDGVWIFVKVRECSEKNQGSPAAFTHAWISTTKAHHTVPNSNVLPGPVVSIMDFSVETTEIDATDRGMGMFVFRQDDVSEAGDIEITSVSLKWAITDQAGEMSEIDIADNYDVNVYAIEMIYVPEGEFYLGDGSSSNCFYDLSGGTSVPYLVESEDAFKVSQTNNRALDVSTGTGNTINAEYPKGYGEFWIMKYEITQYQYASFLNAITPDQANSRTGSDLYTMPSTGNYKYVMVNQNNQNIYYRQAIILDIQGDKSTDVFQVNLNNNNIFDEESDGLGVACNYLSLRDVLAYLDWAALRPLTEFEYEKTCRGPIYPQLNEYAWGNVGLQTVQGIVSSGTADETAISPGVGLCNYGGTGAGSTGPMRVGFAATSTTNRSGAGCSYYGVMDMSGNVFEPYLTCYYNGATGATYSNVFKGQTGDGELDADGYQDVTGWPSHTADADIYHAIAKGGSWNLGNAYLRVSRRADYTYYDTAAEVAVRDYNRGGRGGR